MNAIRYHLAEDTIDKNDIDQLIEWLKTYPRLTKADLTLAFEKKWSDWVGKKYSVFCNSGSSANLLMYYALLLSGVLKNKKIIVPSVGWVTTIAPAIQFGFEPIMCEADKDTFGLDLNHLEKLLQEHNPGAVIMVQVLGVPHKMDELMALKEKYGFVLLEDACAAMGASYHGKKVGSFGDMSSASLYFGHQISTIEGGLVSTDNKIFNDALLMARSHGWSKDLDKETRGQLIKKYGIDDFHAPFVFYEPGFNLRSTDLNAFLGIRQIDKMDWLINRRRENHGIYEKILGGYLYTQKAPADSVVCSIHFGALARDGEERKKIVMALEENGIETRMFSAGNLGLHPFWYNRYGKASFPMADKIHHTGFFLPNNPSLTPKDIEFISSIVLNTLLHSIKERAHFPLSNPSLAPIARFASVNTLFDNLKNENKNENNMENKPVKILITGGAGYIGSVLTSELLKQGHEVTVIDNFMYNQLSLLDSCHYNNLKIARGDGRNEKLIAQHIKEKDFIIPLACLVGAPLCDKDPIAARAVNLEAIKTILRLREPHQKIIFPNTNSGYGRQQEGASFCDENTPLEPISLYGQLKVEAEKAILESGNGITLRLATVFGISPRMRLDLLVNDFVYRALNDRFVVLFEPHFKRNYIHIRDVVRAFIHCMNNFEVMKNETYNVGLSDANLSKLELCQEIQKQLPDFVFMESNIGEDPDKRNYIVSNAKIEKTGFKTQVSLREGIAELIKGYQVIKKNQFANI